ncbi:helix-turn-helix domain-containing protein [Streptomyces albidoflavus]|uniref:helix-turn-helix domain-containing protein n=1 Tax=Streptomyces sp. N1 TaxID=576456 RepID=UPI0010118DA1|nr:helix-turn-helix transcriptional regulator [Streptomyces sp. N1]
MLEPINRRADDDATAPPPSAVAAGRVVGAHLRRLRVENGYLLKDVAPIINASLAKMSRLERGMHPPREQDVAALLKFYDVPETERASIKELVRQSQSYDWWYQFSDVVSGWLERLISMESAATEIRTYEMHYVPGLLQTPAYARAVVSSAFPKRSTLEVEQRVTLRLERQRILQKSSSPAYAALIDEALLNRAIGSNAIFREQLQHLYDLSADKHNRINVRVIPFTAAMKGGAPNASITYIRCSRAGEDEIVYLEQLHGGQYVTGDKVEAYRQTLLNLADAAESRIESLKILQDYIDKLADP